MKEIRTFLEKGPLLGIEKSKIVVHVDLGGVGFDLAEIGIVSDVGGQIGTKQIAQIQCRLTVRVLVVESRQGIVRVL